MNDTQPMIVDEDEWYFVFDLLDPGTDSDWRNQGTCEFSPELITRHQATKPR